MFFFWICFFYFNCCKSPEHHDNYLRPSTCFPFVVFTFLLFCLLFLIHSWKLTYTQNFSFCFFTHHSPPHPPHRPPLPPHTFPFTSLYFHCYKCVSGRFTPSHGKHSSLFVRSTDACLLVILSIRSSRSLLHTS